MSSVELRRKDFLNQYPLLNTMNRGSVHDLQRPKPTHLYIHIPFCYRKCDFCYYKSEILKENEIPQEYLFALKQELKNHAKKNIILRSMYWGGGTPTTMHVKQMQDLLEFIFRLFKRTEDFEFCCEVRPGNELTNEKINLLKEYNVKRISMGLQSLNQQVLRTNGRNHTVTAFYRAYNMLKESGIYSINVDLMSGLIGDTNESFMNSLKELVSLSPENITIYKLQLYYNSKLYYKIREGKFSIMSDLEEAKIISEAYDYLVSNGFEPADNFSFRKSKEYIHLHRVATWDGEDMLGVGASSHSCIDNAIYQNEIDIKKYICKIKDGESVITRAYLYSVYESMVRHFIFGIKSCNYNLDNFEKRFGFNIMKLFENEILWLKKEGYATLDLKKRILCTTKKGTLFADDIVRNFFPLKQKNINMGFENREYVYENVVL